MTTLSELTTPLTVDEVKTAIYAALEAKGAATTTWKPGGVVRTLIAGTSIVLAALSRLQAALANGGFLELAEGDWLTLVAEHVYGVERDLGAFAAGTVTLDNGGGGVYSGGVGDLIVSNGDGKTYRNTAAFSIGALETGVEVPIEAVEIGVAGGSTGAGTIETLETVLLGVGCTNAAALVGRDEETDEELRIRCRARTGALSPNGPRDAYAYIAQTTLTADDEPIGVTRVRTVADGDGAVDVYLASDSGAVTAPNVALIQTAINEMAEPLAVTATAISATNKTISVTYEAWVRDTIGLTVDQIETAVEAALDEFFAATPIGGDIITGEATGRVYLSAIEGAIAQAIGDDLVRLEVTVPAGDTDIAISEVPIRGTLVVTAIHEVTTGAA